MIHKIIIIIFYIVGLFGLLMFGYTLLIQLGFFPNHIRINTDGGAIGVVIMMIVMSSIILWASKIIKDGK